MLRCGRTGGWFGPRRESDCGGCRPCRAKGRERSEALQSMWEQRRSGIATQLLPHLVVMFGVASFGVRAAGVGGGPTVVGLFVVPVCRVLPGFLRLVAGVFSRVLRVIHESHVSRSEEHTSELQSLMRISYAVF